MDNEIAALFLDYSCKKLDGMTENLRVCLGKLNDAQVWERHGAHENAVGNLVLHLCGNMRQWVMHGVGGAKDVRGREAGCSAEGGRGGAGLMEVLRAAVAGGRAGW